MMRCDTQPAITGFEVGRVLEPKNDWLPLETGKCKQKYAPHDPPYQEQSPADTLV